MDTLRDDQEGWEWIPNNRSSKTSRPQNAPKPSRRRDRPGDEKDTGAIIELPLVEHGATLLAAIEDMQPLM